MARAVPVQRRSRERVELIMRAAAELLAEGGVEALTTRSLAQHAGIPVATIYRYFEDRDAIIAAYLDFELEEIERSARAALLELERVTFRSMANAVTLAHLRHHQSHPEGVPVWFGSRLNLAVQDRVRELDRRMAGQLLAASRGAGFIEEGPHFGANLIVRLLDRTFEHIFRIDRAPAEQEAIITEVVDMISTYMERYATPAALEGIPAEELVRALGLGSERPDPR